MIPPELKFHHRYLVNGEMTPGDWDQSALEALLQPYSAFLQKKTVLDVGTLDGKWAFWAEDQGASVVTCDIKIQPTFTWAWKERKSDICPFPWGVEDLDPEMDEDLYDHIIDFGVYYHVHDIVGHFQALKKLLVQSPDSRVFVEGEVTLGHTSPVVEFYARGYPGPGGDPTTFWVPTVAALTDICELAGFEMAKHFHVYRQHVTRNHQQGRAFGILKHAQ